MSDKDNLMVDSLLKQFNDFFKQYLTNPVFRSNIDFLMRVPIQAKDTQNMLKVIDIIDEKYDYELSDKLSKKPWIPNILDKEASFKLINTPPLRSFCRLGDGECELILGRSIGFQEANDTLAEKLKQILIEGGHDNCYVGLPRNFFMYTPKKRNFNETPAELKSKIWDTFTSPMHRKVIIDHCNRDRIYISTGFCLSYVTKNSIEDCEKHFKKVKSLFKGKKLVIFAGETVFDKIQYDVFEEAQSKVIVLAPRINAWRAYDDIMNKALSFPKDHILCFILGPTATVLAYELSKHGRIAWDIGHIAKDYDAFMKRASKTSEIISNFWAPD